MANPVRIKNFMAKSFIERCMTAMEVCPSHATQLADVLVEADYRGHFSHGLNRLEMYVTDQKHGMTSRDGEPQIIKEQVSTAYVDGRNLLGPVVGNFCMQIAIEKARKTGISIVTAKATNHFGIAGWYSLQASRQGLLGLTFTNSSPLQVATRGKQAILGTNPISLAAPSKDIDDHFLLDMATSAVALGKLELAKVKNAKIPLGWAIDDKGKETTDPAIMIGGQGALLPLGGSEANSGYKGYGLAMLVEIFCGILADSKYGPNVRSWKINDRIADLGQCFIAIDPDAFAPGFKDRMFDLMQICRNTQPVDPDFPVLVAGDPERHHMKMCDEEGGIPYHRNVINIMDKLSKELKIEAINK